MRIVVDAFGGDNAPLCNIEGALAAREEYNVDVVLSGNGEKLKKCAEENGLSLDGIEILEAPEVFSMYSQPTDILRSGKNTSLAVGMQYVADGNADAFVSAGSTGAIVVGGTFICRRIKGVKRPALGSLVPTENGTVMLTDIGANADCRPEMLRQFAVMANAYLNKVSGIKSPKIGLLNIGTEDSKGGELQIEAFRLLKSAPIDFVGNIEAREIAKGPCDAVISDGFTGNVALKMYEGVAITLFSIIKKTFRKNLKTKLAGLLAKRDMRGLKKLFDASEVGGAPLLGVAAPVIKAHGNSDKNAIKNAIRQAKLAAENGLCAAIAEGIAASEAAGKEE